MCICVLVGTQKDFLGGLATYIAIPLSTLACISASGYTHDLQGFLIWILLEKEKKKAIIRLFPLGIVERFG
jgi:hypothetical protein